MHRNHGVRKVAGMAILVAAGVAAGNLEGAVRAQSDLLIDHKGVECLPTNRFTLFTAAVTPIAEVQHARLYFRAEQFSEFYYVNMKTIAEDRFQASIPLPAEETRRVVYYIEAMTRAFQSTRTAEHISVVSTEEECRRRDPAAAYFPGQNPGIQVFPTQAGPAFPPGFVTAGVVPGIAAGGVGVGTAILIGAAGAGTAGVIAVVTGGDTSTTTTVVLASSSVPTTTSAPPPADAKACFETSPNPPVIFVGDSIRLDATCSEPRGSLTYDWELGDGRTRDGRVITPVYNAPGVYTVTLTVRTVAPLRSAAGAAVDRFQRDVTVLVRPTTTTTSEPAPTTSSTSTAPTTSIIPNVDLQAAITGPANIAPNTNATYNVTSSNNGPQTDPAVTLNVTFTANNPANTPVAVLPLPAGCSSAGGGGSLNVTCNLGAIAPAGNVLRVIVVQFPANDIYTNTAQVAGAGNDINPGNNTQSVITNVPLRVDREEFSTSFASFLGISPFDGGARGEILLNGSQLVHADSSAPAVHHLRARIGENSVEARLVSGGSSEGFWRFDFSATPQFEPGSLVLVAGDLLSLDGRSVTFRVSGVAGERVKFTYRLKP